MRPPVRLEVRALGVDLVASFIVTLVYPPLDLVAAVCGGGGGRRAGLGAVWLRVPRGLLGREGLVVTPLRAVVASLVVSAAVVIDNKLAG